MTSPHLSEEQICEYLSDPAADSEAALHLAQCASCMAAVQSFRTSIESFGIASLSWSEARAASNSPVSSPGWSARPMWAFAALLVIAIAIFAAGRLHILLRNSAVAAPNIEAVNGDSPSDIARDNQLMSAVNVEINRREPSPLVEYNLPPDASPRSRTSPRARVE